MIITSKPLPEKEPSVAAKKVAVGVLIALVGAIVIWAFVHQAATSDPATIRPTAPQTTSERATAPAKTGVPEARATVAQSGAALEPTATASQTALVKIKYETVTSQEWQAIAEDPDGHAGEAIVLYGYVTQADSAATGEGLIRVGTDAVRHRGENGYRNYEVNAILTAGTVDLADLVEGDIFKLKGLITGGRADQSTLAGELIAPLVTVNSLTVLGSTDN